MASLDVIAIEGLTVDCVVGVYPEERDRLQALEVSLRLFLDTRRAAAEQRLERSVDYGAVANQVAFLLQNGRFYMLETAARVLTRLLLAPLGPGERAARPAAVELRLRKPLALGGHGVPSLSVRREVEEVDVPRLETPYGHLDTVAETKQLGVYRVHLAPGARIPLHAHERTREAEMVLGDGLLVSGRRVAPGVSHRWPRGAVHGYANPTARWQRLLRVDSPPQPADARAADGPPAEVEPDPPFIPGAGRRRRR